MNLLNPEGQYIIDLIPEYNTGNRHPQPSPVQRQVELDPLPHQREYLGEPLRTSTSIKYYPEELNELTREYNIPTIVPSNSALVVLYYPFKLYSLLCRYSFWNDEIQDFLNRVIINNAFQQASEQIIGQAYLHPAIFTRIENIASNVFEYQVSASPYVWKNNEQISAVIFQVDTNIYESSAPIGLPTKYITLFNRGPIKIPKIYDESTENGRFHNWVQYLQAIQLPFIRAPDWNR
jgi:hypothetical protein